MSHLRFVSFFKGQGNYKRKLEISHMKFSFVSIISKTKSALKMEKSTSNSKNLKVTDEELESLREGIIFFFFH